MIYSNGKEMSDKLYHEELETLKVKRKILDINYELDLPVNVRIHLVFHVSLLETAPG